MVKDGKTTVEIDSFNNRQFARWIKNPDHCEDFMQAIRNPDKRIIEDVLYDKKQAARKKEKTKPLPKDARRVWELLDPRRNDRIKESNWIILLERRVKWIS